MTAGQKAQLIVTHAAATGALAATLTAAVQLHSWGIAVAAFTGATVGGYFAWRRVGGAS